MMDSRQTSIVNFVKARLLSNDTIKVKNVWCSECVEFFVAQSQLDNEMMYQQVREQFLLADMKEASNPIIPASIQQKKEAFTLNGNFVLQLQYLIDIAESPYEQWRRLHNIKLDEVVEIRESRTFSNKKKRVMRLELTDGVRHIQAMEYTPLPVLNSKLPPGTKLCITGPVQVVNHVLMLKPENLKILGGDVDSLLISNAYENVLLRALNRPTTQTPILDYIDEVPAESQRGNFAPRQATANNRMQHDDDLLAGIDFDQEDNVDMDLLVQIEQNERQNQINRRPPSVDIDFDDDDDILAQIDLEQMEHAANQSAANAVIEIPNHRPPARPVIKGNDLLMPIIRIPDDEEEKEEAPTSIASTFIRVPSKSAPSISDGAYKFKSHCGDNMTTIDQYLALKIADRLKRDFVVLARVGRISLNTLRINGDTHEWRLQGEIKDSYSHQPLLVRFHNKVLEKLSGYTGTEMSLLWREVRLVPERIQVVNQVIEDLKDKLSTVECLMRISFNYEPPLKSEFVVVELLEDNADDHQSFKRKLKEENLKTLE